METIYKKPYLLSFVFVLVIATAISSRYVLKKSEQVPVWTKARWQELTKCKHPHYPAPKAQNRELYINTTFLSMPLQLTISEVVLCVTNFIAVAIAIFLSINK